MTSLFGTSTWLVYLGMCFVLWSTYVIPGNFAEKTHGPSVNFFFEAAAFAFVALLLSNKIAADFHKVTWSSALLGSLMGLGSAVGFYFFLQSLSLAPGANGIVLILLVAGITFPLQGALFSIKLFGGEPLSTQQWIALAGMGGCIALFNWKF